MRVLAFLLLLGVAWCQNDALSVSVKPAGSGIARPLPIGPPFLPPGDCICTLEFAPVCGTNGKTFGNRCEAGCSRVPVKCEGRCPCPRDPPFCACSREFNPVCGADGTTYSNPCLARCKTSIKCNRPCPCKPTPPSDCIFSNGVWIGCNPSPSPTPTPGSINDLLDDCVEKGKTAAVAAARAACSVVKLECPASRPTFQASSLAAGASVSRANPADAFLDAVLDRACFVEARSACKSNALASISDDACSRILSVGPAAPGRKCSSLRDAVKIFEAQVDSACQKRGTKVPQPFPIG